MLGFVCGMIEGAGGQVRVRLDVGSQVQGKKSVLMGITPLYWEINKSNEKQENVPEVNQRLIIKKAIIIMFLCNKVFHRLPFHNKNLFWLIKKWQWILEFNTIWIKSTKNTNLF